MQFKTPGIPRWIMKIRNPYYRNIFEYNLGNQNLWGTETLLGDWSGQYLVIAQDFYPSTYIEQNIKSGLSNPYCHKDGIPTSNLVKTLRHFGHLNANQTNTNCGFLYASACFLLRADGNVRGPLPDRANVLHQSLPVLKFTIDNMRSLKSVIAMGKPAADAVFKSPLSKLLKDRQIQAFEVSHPSYAMTDEVRMAQWEPVFSDQNRRKIIGLFSNLLRPLFG